VRFVRHFLPRELCSAQYMPWSCVCVGLSVYVCPSQVGVLLKWLNIGICKLRHTMAQGLYFYDAKNLFEIQPGSPPTGAQMQVGYMFVDVHQVGLNSLIIIH